MFGSLSEVRHVPGRVEGEAMEGLGALVKHFRDFPHVQRR